MSISEVHLGIDGAGDREVDINIWFGGHILEVDGSVVLVFGFRQIESELVIDGKIIEAAGVDRISEIMVLSVALFTMVPSYTLGRAKAVARPVVAGGALTVALTRLALAPVDRVAEEALSTLLAVVASCVVETGAADSLLFFFFRVTFDLDAGAVAITLAGRALCEVPPGRWASVTWDPAPLVTSRVGESAGAVQGTTSSSL